MTANSNTCNQIELNGDELNLVVGGWGSYYWAPPTPTTTENPAVQLSAIQPIHLAPLPPLHTAVPHF